MAHGKVRPHDPRRRCLMTSRHGTHLANRRGCGRSSNFSGCSLQMNSARITFTTCVDLKVLPARGVGVPSDTTLLLGI
jgi:hypothetical protein